MPLREAVSLALLLMTGTAALSQEGAPPEPDPIGQFEGGHLEVGEDRLTAGEPARSQGASADWDALWQAYVDGIVEECRSSASGQLDGARCDDMVIVRGPAAEPESAEGMPAITISDLERFAPVAGELVVEPDGWGVVGTPTNFYATAEAHTMQGELFETPIEVRWTPTSYVFNYGDGTVQESEASGTAWRGTEESWTETATSHTYATTDDVTASLTVVFTAEVDAGSGWFSVPGTLAVDAPAVDVKVFEVDTVLTNGDCTANPAAQGCG